MSGKDQDRAVKVQKRVGHGRECVGVWGLRGKQATHTNGNLLKLLQGKTEHTIQIKNQKNTMNKKKRNSGMTNAVYSCWCFNGGPKKLKTGKSGIRSNC